MYAVFGLTVSAAKMETMCLLKAKMGIITLRPNQTVSE